MNGTSVSTPYELPSSVTTITVTCDMIISGPGNPVKLVLGKNDDVNQLHEINFVFEGVAPVPNPLPHIDIPTSYWSRFSETAVVEGTAFSSLENITTIYPPVAFTADVDLTNETALKDFFVNNITSKQEITVDTPLAEYTVDVTSTEISHAYSALTGGYGMNSDYASSGVSLVMALDPSSTDFQDLSGDGNHATVVNNINVGLTAGEDADGK